MAETEPFFVPLGDEIILHGAANLKFTTEICSAAGGPNGIVEGHVWLTQDWLAFRPNVGMPHPQLANLSRDRITDCTCVHPKLLGLLRIGRPRLEVQYHYVHLGGSTPHVFRLDAPERWVEALRSPRRVQKHNARELVQQAIRAGERQRGRFTGALKQLSFPNSWWETEDVSGRDEALMDGLKALGIEVPGDFLSKIDLSVQVDYGPEEYRVGPGSEEWGRREQIRRVCEAINELNGKHGRRFYEYAEDLPGWETPFEPLWLWLSAPEDEALRRLGIVAPVGASPTRIVRSI